MVPSVLRVEWVISGPKALLESVAVKGVEGLPGHAVPAANRVMPVALDRPAPGATPAPEVLLEALDHPVQLAVRGCGAIPVILARPGVRVQLALRVREARPALLV